MITHAVDVSQQGLDWVLPHWATFRVTLEDGREVDTAGEFCFVRAIDIDNNCYLNAFLVAIGFSYQKAFLIPQTWQFM